MISVKTKASKLLALILALGLLLSVVPVATFTASAADGEIIVTVKDPGYKEEGVWSDSGVKGYNDLATRFANGISKATFTPTIVTAGTYKVEVYKVTHTTSDPNQIILINSVSGQEKKIIDVVNGTAGWQDVGTYQFAAGTTGNVVMDRPAVVGETHTRTSAVRFTLVKAGGTGAPAGAAPTTAPTAAAPTTAPTTAAPTTAPTTAPEYDAEYLASLPFSDIAGSSYVKAISLLNAINVIVGDAGTGTFRPNDTISRSELTAIIVRILGQEDAAIAQKGETKYSDVKADHWASGYINFASSIGFIKGDGDGTFRPDDKVLYQEAVKMLVAATGYEIYAPEKGGYPTGYLVMANQLKIADGIKGASSTEPAKREIIAQLVANALDVDILTQQGYGETVKYVSNPGETLLTEKLNIYKVKGEVTGNYTTRLTGDSNLKEDEAEIDGFKYFIGKTKVASLLGYSVEAYAHEMDIEGDYELIYVIPQENKNIITKVNADDIDADTTSTLFQYWKNDSDTKPTELQLKGSTRLIYNGKANVSLVDDDLKPEAGEVILLDSDGDEKIDVVYVTEIQNYFVKRTNKSYYEITDEYGKGVIKIDLEDKKNKVTITKDGSPAEFSDIAEKDVVSIAVSNSGTTTAYTLNVSSDSVDGKITEFDDDKIVIDNEEYEYAASLKAAFAREDDKAVIKPEIDDEGTFYLDVTGKIAGFEITASASANYGVLLDIGVKSKIDTEISFLIRTTNNETITALAADKVNIVKGAIEQKVNIEGLLDALKTSGVVEATGDFKKKLIKYDVNSSGELTSITLPINISTTMPYEQTDEQLKEFRLNYQLSNDSDGTEPPSYTINLSPDKRTSIISGNKFESGGPNFAEYTYNANTWYLLWPQDGGADIYSNDDIIFKKGGATTGYVSNLYGYDANEDGVFGLLVTKQSIKYMKETDGYMIVSAISKAIVDGEETYKLSGYGLNGAKADVTAKNASVKDIAEAAVIYTVDSSNKKIPINKTMKDIKVGDVINYNNMPGNKMIAFKLVYSPDTTYVNSNYTFFVYTGSANVVDAKYLPDYQFTGAYSTIDEFDGDRIFYYVDVDTKKRKADVEGAKIYIYDYNTGKVSVSSASEIRKDDKFYLRIQLGVAKDIMIIRNYPTPPQGEPEPVVDPEPTTQP